MLTLNKYWMGRDVRYAEALTPEIEANAVTTVHRINLLVAEFEAETGIVIETWTSGWRPPAVNSGTANAATGSRHLTARAGDVRDTALRAFASWCLRNLDRLERIGLWIEDPQWTPTWVHLQTVQPKSGLRVYRPSDVDPLVPRLPEQGGVAA